MARAQTDATDPAALEIVLGAAGLGLGMGMAPPPAYVADASPPGYMAGGLARKSRRPGWLRPVGLRRAPQTYGPLRQVRVGGSGSEVPVTDGTL
jgi:hypothetical protein